MEKTLNFYEKVALIQSRLNAPKNLINKFGGYSYRNVEGIYEALKPLLTEYSLVLQVTDNIIEISNRIYIEATATITDGKEALSVKGYARETEFKKGMDEAQVTGSCSSYARKYALGGLLLIDDNKDIDEMEHSEQKPVKIIKKDPAKDINVLFNKTLEAFQEYGIYESDLLQYLGLKNKAEIKEQNISELREYFKQVKNEHNYTQQKV